MSLWKTERNIPHEIDNGQRSHFYRHTVKPKQTKSSIPKRFGIYVRVREEGGEQTVLYVIIKFKSVKCMKPIRNRNDCDWSKMQCDTHNTKQYTNASRPSLWWTEMVEMRDHVQK